MSQECKYYFAFRKKDELYGYWVEIFTCSEREAVDVFEKCYGRYAWPINKNALKFHPKGCYREIHLPLPENIKIDSEDPFFSEPKKRDDFIWAIIGQNSWGKSNVSYQQQIERIRRIGQKNKIIILDDYRTLLDNKNKI